jgi:hypothetical protein
MQALQDWGGGAKRLASGGMAADISASLGTPSLTTGPVAGQGSKLEVGLEEGLVLRHLDTPAGQKTLLQVLGKNKNQLRNMLK